MSGWWLASHLLLWALLIATLLVLLIVLRQLGLIYLRMRGGGLRLDEGPALGVALQFDEIDINDEQLRFPVARDALNLLLFTSPWCAICKEALRGLAPALSHHNVRAVVVDAGEAEEARVQRDLIDADVGFIASLKRQKKIGIETIPYAIVTNGEGVIIGKGIVNNLADLEDLLEASEAHLGGHLQSLPA